MNIEQKMAFIQKAIEMGADVELSFHDFRVREEAEKAAVELSALSKKEYVLKTPVESDSILRWFKIYNDEAGIETVIFFDEKVEEETA